jgi:hypothetical protein
MFTLSAHIAHYSSALLYYYNLKSDCKDYSKV